MLWIGERRSKPKLSLRRGRNAVWKCVCHGPRFGFAHFGTAQCRQYRPGPRFHNTQFYPSFGSILLFPRRPLNPPEGDFEKYIGNVFILVSPYCPQIFQWANTFTFGLLWSLHDPIRKVPLRGFRGRSPMPPQPSLILTHDRDLAELHLRLAAAAHCQFGAVYGGTKPLQVQRIAIPGFRGGKARNDL